VETDEIDRGGKARRAAADYQAVMVEVAHNGRAKLLAVGSGSPLRLQQGEEK
jgi:hypothetical protein